MTLLVAMLALLQDAKYATAAEAIELPKDLATWAEKGSMHKKAVDVIGDRKLWAKGLQQIDEKLGLFVEKPKIVVVVEESDDARPAKGKGARGEGEVRFNIRVMAEYIRKLEAFDEMEMKGKELRFRVPPTPVATLVQHELVHCFAGQADEAWLTEGLAVWVAGETAHLWDFQNRRARLEGLGAVAERDHYARGYCAVAWLHEKYGGDKVKAVVARLLQDKSATRKALAEATGKAWETVAAEELEWTREFLKKYTPD